MVVIDDDINENLIKKVSEEEVKNIYILFLWEPSKPHNQMVSPWLSFKSSKRSLNMTSFMLLEFS